MTRKSDEWLKQADYDIGTAEAMHNSGRYIHSVFMCHLAVEKALKGLYVNLTQKTPPKTHNLIYFLKEVEGKPNSEIQRFIVKLNTASIATRYPEDLNKLVKVYSKDVSAEFIINSKEVLAWVKMNLTKT